MRTVHNLLPNGARAVAVASGADLSDANLSGDYQARNVLTLHARIMARLTGASA